MGNPPRKKGSAYEVQQLAKHVRRIWPDAERAPLKGTLDYGDYTNIDGWLVEAKKRNRWDIREWVRGVVRKISREGRKGAPWVILFAGDKRVDPNFDLCVQPTAQWVGLMRRLKTLEEMLLND